MGRPGNARGSRRRGGNRGHEKLVDHEILEDLAEKEWVILLEGPGQEILGFSTMMLYHTVFEGEAISVLFSGDTIVG